MVDLTELLGHRKLATDLFAALSVLGSRRWLRGPSGSGKTEIARAVADRWLERGGDVHWLAGTAGNDLADHAAAYRALRVADPDRKIRKAIQSQAVEPLRDVPLVGNTLAAAASILLSRLEANRPDFLTAEQQDLFAGFERGSTTELVLFVVDDVHLLDKGSAELFEMMRRPEVASAYSFVRRSSFLFVETIDQAPRLDATLLDALRQDAGIVSVRYPTIERYPDILKAMGLRSPLDDEMYRNLYNLTRGHLKLANEIARLFDNRDTAEAIGSETANVKVDELAAALLRARLSSLPRSSDKLRRLLAIAACLGKSFSRRELECAFSEPSTFTNALDLARQEEYVSGEGDALQFTHEIIQAAVRYLDSSEDAAYYDRLAECVRYLRPGDYFRRYTYSARTENGVRTAELLVSLSLQEARGEAMALPDVGTRSQDAGELTLLMTAAWNAVKAMDEGKHSAAVRLLLPFYDGSNSLAQGEIAYLLALNYYKGRSIADYEQARAILESWATRRDEGELWFRMMLTLAVVNASVNDRRGAVEVLQRVRLYLDRTAAYDPTAHAKMQVLNRKAEIFYPIEVAGQLIKSAVEYFGPSPTLHVPRNAFQYTAALVNLSGNLYVRGEFDAAIVTAGRAVQCLTQLSGRVRLVEPYRALNNYVIAAYRAGKLSSAEAADVLAAVAEGDSTTDGLDRSLVATNLGGLRLLAGDIDGACRLLEQTYSRLTAFEADGYYLLYAASNLAAGRYLSEQTREALELLDVADAHVHDMPIELSSCMRKRLIALRQAFSNPEKREPQALDRFPGDSLGKEGSHVAWRSLGWGIGLSDIQVWSES